MVIQGSPTLLSLRLFLFLHVVTNLRADSGGDTSECVSTLPETDESNVPGSVVSGLRLRGAGLHKLAPALNDLSEPSMMAASKELNMSELFEPLILTGLVREGWKLSGDFLQHESKKLRVDVNPLPDGDSAPRKLLDNSTLIMPATLPLPTSQVLDLLRKDPSERGFHAYVRHLSLDSFPEVSHRTNRMQLLWGDDALNTGCETAAAWKSIASGWASPEERHAQSANLWLGDGAMRSPLHWDGHDNLLLQLCGTKTALLLPPEATPHLGYRAWSEHRYVLDGQTQAFLGHRSEDSTVENHAVFDAFDPALTQLPESVPWDRARVAVLQPGQALFLPALWSHAVVSTPAGPDDAEGAGLNLALNLWFVHRCKSHKSALEFQPAWAQGYFCLGNDLGSARRYVEAAAAFEGALRVRPDYFDAANNLASMLEAQGKYTEAEAQYRAASGMKPSDAQCLNNLGVVLRRQGRLDEAAEAYEQAIALNDREGASKAELQVLAKSLGLLGNTRAVQERLADADASLQRATELAPTDSKAFNSHGVVLEQQGRVDEAVAAYRRALALNPDDGKAQGNLNDLLARHPGHAS